MYFAPLLVLDHPLPSFACFVNKAIFLLVFRLATFIPCLFTGVGGRTSGLPLERCIVLSFLPGMGWFPLRNHVDCTNIRIFIIPILLNSYARLKKYMLSKVRECNLLSYALKHVYHPSKKKATCL